MLGNENVQCGQIMRAVLQDTRVWRAAFGRQFPEPLLAKVANYTCGWVPR